MQVFYFLLSFAEYCNMIKTFKYNLFLDDIRMPKDVIRNANALHLTPELIEHYKGVWVIVRNYNDFVEYITEHGLPEIISFDHDLADEHYRESMYDPDIEHYSKYYSDGTFKEKTGYNCAKWLIEYCLDNKEYLPVCLIHTQNPVGRLNILSLITSYNKIKNES